MKIPEVFFKGSVKDIRGIKGQSPYYFEYSDRFSVFDWGAMPDLLEAKGKALANLAHFFFNYLEAPKNWINWQLDDSIKDSFKNKETYKDLCNKGLEHHSLGLINFNSKNLTKPEEISNYLKVKAVNVLNPKEIEGKTLDYDYSIYSEKQHTNSLVPLEVIFRFSIASGSSLLSRVDSTEYLSQLGLTSKPKEGDEFNLPIIEFSTKLETTDRYISKKEAQSISGMNKTEFQKLYDLSSLLALRLKTIFNFCDIQLLDGKMEFAFSPDLDNQGNRSFSLVDSIGPDELRLIYKKTQLSKESLRSVYRSSPWYKALKESKKIALSRGSSNWRQVCVKELNANPPHLDIKTKACVSHMYLALTNVLYKTFYEKIIFKEALSLDEVAKTMKSLKL